jgi:Xaa-Pro dipeptidase
MTTSLTAVTTALDIPDLPDRGRMYRESGARLRAAMADNGVDALILLGNGNVVYVTGASWPLLDAGLSHVERPVAIVLADDEHPHLFMPFREGAASESEIPADHLHPPLYLEFDEGVDHFARVISELITSGATVAVDELTGAMRRAADRLFPGGPLSDAAPVVGAAKLVKTPDQIAASERPAASPKRRSSTCRRRWCPVSVRSTCPHSSCVARSSWARRPTCSRRSGR